mgnify:CR=1 FL=1
MISIPRTKEKAHQIMIEIMSGRYATPDLVDFLQHYQAHFPTEEIMNEFLGAIKQSAVYLLNTADFDKPIIDLAGTGGDGKHTVNLSTLAALTAATTGLVKAVKYGNRSATSVCGSMDVLEATGLDIELSEATLKKQLTEKGFAPLYARAVYPGGKFVAAARSIVEGPTIFNILFPLARPIIGQARFVFGIAKPEMIKPIEKLYLLQPKTRCLLVRGLDGVDEVSITGEGKTQYSLIENGQMKQGVFSAQEVFGIEPIDLSLLQIETKQEAVDVFLQVFNPAFINGKVKAIREAVAANAACALFVALDEGNMNIAAAKKYLEILNNVLRTGKALKFLDELKESKI